MAQDPDAGISVLLDRPIDPFSREIRTAGEDTGRWLGLIARHKELADLHHDFLVRVFDPLVPATFQQLAVRYNIPSRLWQTGFHLILERLRHAWMSHQPAALDLLTDFVYDSYKFYTDLLEDQSLLNFRTAWIEALGDLARYRMAIASHLASETKPQSSTPVFGTDDDNDEPQTSGASIGAEVAENWDVEDKETWRTTARDWYNMGITEKPGEGRLHHHLALLSRDVPGQEARALHHFTKSLVVTHQFETSRESILPLFDSALQSQRSLPEATAVDLFVRLHGMLFTKISLDNFPSVMSRYIERLQEDASLDGVSRKATITQVDWMLMASVNLAAILQYGAATGIIRKALAQEGYERRKMQAAAGDEDGDGEGEGDLPDPSGPSTEEGEVPPPSHNDAPITPTYTYALQLAFEVFQFTLSHPNRLQGLHSVLNPYLTLFCTFLSTLFRQPHVATLLIPSVPWIQLVDFINAANLDIREETRLAFGPPLPEDWAVRGMEWVGRRTYERGFWKAKGSARSSGALAQPRIGERFQSEMDVLLANFDSSIDISEGVVDEIDGTDLTDGPVAVNQRRWRRVAWAAGVLVKHVDGFRLEEGKIVIEGALAARLAEIAAAKKAEAEEQEALQRRSKVVTALEDYDEEVVESDGDGDGDGDDPELAVLRERRRYLRSLLNAPSTQPVAKVQSSHKALHVVPGYTMLVFDTNVLLSALSLFSKVVEGGQWSVVVPLPVVTELDGLSKSTPPLGLAAQSAITYLESRIRTHSLCLKIQTSRGNYLSDLLIRTETHNDRSSKTMDDLILGIASFQAEHFVDRSALLGASGAGPGATKVLLITFDRNLRLKARSVGVDAADEKEMASILGKG
ncbi:hypothetical protein BCR39DRAFT_474669 [Naematelia encephala]|uniref:PIN domain-containing protein n=1 Tax=Naematelia encephala TaxID=71784 RepID=A0A1Y2AET6_9TREE|nr:hypothetical protein BCR39DRAFT_474669 [Naematelia encephala]